MQLKSFSAGMVAGAVLTVLVAVVFQQDNIELDLDNTASEANPAVTGKLGADAENPNRLSTDNGESSVRDDMPSVAPIAKLADNDLTDISRVDPEPIDPAGDSAAHVPLTDSHKKLLGEEGRVDRNSGRPGDVHSALENEPKDHDWSYFMEQALGQYLGSHPEIANFDIAGIECRTTICEIQAFGVDERAGPRWSIILHDLRNQPWSDFGQTGSSSSTMEGRLVIVSHLHRLTKQQ